jgi:hypothetical protein
LVRNRVESGSFSLINKAGRIFMISTTEANILSCKKDLDISERS